MSFFVAFIYILIISYFSKVLFFSYEFDKKITNSKKAFYYFKTNF